MSDVLSSRIHPSPQQIQALEDFERRSETLHMEELTLEKRANDAITILGTNMKLIIGLTVGSSAMLLVNRGNLLCDGRIRVALLSLFSFIIGFVIATMVAFNKIKRLNRPFQELMRRQRELYHWIIEFKREITLTVILFSREHRMITSSEESGPAALMDSTFSKRLRDVENTLSQLIDFWGHYKKKILSWIAFGVVLHVISNPLVASFLFCKGEGNGATLLNLISKCHHFRDPPKIIKVFV